MIYNHNNDILIENINKNGNKVLIWGACKRNDEILDFFRRQNINVVGYIDRNADKQTRFNDLPVFDRNIIKNDKYYIFVGLLDNYEDIISHLKNCGYNEFDDYWYPGNKVTIDGSQPYKDIYGNEYTGRNHNIKIRLSNGSKVIIEDNCKFGNACIESFNSSAVRIGDGIIFVGNTFIHSNTFSEIEINERTSSGTNSQIIAIQNSKVTIGKNSMLSSDVIIRAGNSHNIFDLENKENLVKDGYSVAIGDHVWVGTRSTLFNGCEIGSGSIVGINTFVNKKFPSNCSIAGNPARIIKENIAWRREGYPYFDDYDDFAEFDFR